MLPRARDSGEEEEKEIEKENKKREGTRRDG